MIYISAFRSDQAEFEEKIMEKQLKGTVTVVKQHTQKLCKEFNCELQELQ
jgi:hypothetical protein